MGESMASRASAFSLSTTNASLSISYSRFVVRWARTTRCARSHIDAPRTIPTGWSVYVRNVSLEEVLLWERQSARAELIDGAPSWQTTDAIEPHRRARREQAIPRDALIGRLLEHSRLITPELGKPLMESSDARELADYKRLRLDWVATTPVGLAAFDYLFNGRDGLRGYYARSPVLGELFARELLLGARGFAIAAIKDSNEACDLATTSYDAISTKVWPSEGTLQLASPAAAVPAIAVPSWIGALGAWRADPASASMVAGWGVQAPGVSRLEIKGGFRRADGVEWIPARKLHRADELHRYGWS